MSAVIKTAPGGQRYAVVASRSQMVTALVSAAAQGALSLVLEHERGGTAQFKLAYRYEARDEQWQLVSSYGFMSYRLCAQACEQANARLLSEALS